ncbi:MAG: hypothetical protein LC624_09410 [Halobacteriales archaeon]|nr:hypothetical protein [Halobacteriales archaeon]
MHRAAYVGWALLFVSSAFIPLASSATVTQTWTQTSQTDFLQGSGTADVTSSPGEVLPGGGITTDPTKYTRDQDAGCVYSYCLTAQQVSGPYVTSGQGAMYFGRQAYSNTCCPEMYDRISTPAANAGGTIKVYAYDNPSYYGYGQYYRYIYSYLTITDGQGHRQDTLVNYLYMYCCSSYQLYWGSYNAHETLNGWGWYRYDLQVPDYFDQATLRVGMYQDTQMYNYYCCYTIYLLNYFAFAGPSTSEFVSNVHDAGSSAQWSTLTYEGSVPAGSTLKLQTRTSGDGSTFSDWATALSGEPVASPGGRFIQYRALFTSGTNGPARLQSVSITSTTSVDTNPPVTLASVSGAAGCDGWLTSTPTVTLQAQDDLSGVGGTFWSLDGGFFVPYGSAFPVDDGAHTLKYYSVDGAGNIEGVRSLSFKADTQVPQTSLSVTGPAFGGFVAPGTQFALSASDATSGLRSTSVDTGSGLAAYAGAFSLGGPDGARAVAWRSEDNACNAEALQSRGAFVDGTAPSVAITHPTAGSARVLDHESSDLPMFPAAVGTLDGLGLHGSDVDAMVAIIDRGALEECGPALAERCAALALAELAPRLGGSVVIGAVDVAADASDPVVNGGASGLARVAFYLDGELKDVQTSAPFTWHWDATDAAAGQHSLQVVAQDNLGNTATASTSVSVIPAGAMGVLGTGGFVLHQLGAPQFALDLVDFVLAKVLGLPVPGVPGADGVAQQVQDLLAQLPPLPDGVPDPGDLPDPGSLVPGGLPSPGSLPPLPQLCVGDTCVPP